MKNCVKIVILAIILILSTTLNLYAVDYADTPMSNSTAQVTIIPTPTNVKAGETFTITLSAKCKNTIEGITAYLEYDESKLELTSNVALSGFIDMSGVDEKVGKFKIQLLSGQDSVTEADVGTLTFKVLDTVYVNENLEIKLTDIEVIDFNFETTNIEEKELVITVIDGEEEQPGNDEENKDDNDGENDEENKEDNDGENDEENKDDNDGENDEENKEDNDGENGEGNNEGDNSEGNSNINGDGSKEENEKDTTIADKPINNAGKGKGFTILGIMALIAIVLYRKCQKYKEVK